MTNSKKIFDSWLVLEFKSGNNKAMSLLVKRWHKKMCRHSHWYTGDPEIAKDIVQDCWGIIIRKIGGLKEVDRFGSWALSIVTRRSIDWLRKNKREYEHKKQYYERRDNHSNNDQHDDPTEPMDLLRKHIQALPEGQKQVLVLFYLEEMSINEISEALQLAAGTVKSRLFNAREKLRLTLKNRNDEK
jgi:RNA polymerase sigma factor (sigma-70 family)